MPHNIIKTEQRPQDVGRSRHSRHEREQVRAVHPRQHLVRNRATGRAVPSPMNYRGLPEVNPVSRHDPSAKLEPCKAIAAYDPRRIEDAGYDWTAGG